LTLTKSGHTLDKYGNRCGSIMKRLLFLATAVVLCLPALSAGQTLADVARAEEARRKTVKKAGKVYTNDTLKQDFTAPATAAPEPAAGAPAERGEPGASGHGQPPGQSRPSAPAAETSDADAPPAAKAKPAAAAESRGDQGEMAWRNKMSAARAELQRSQMFAEALQSRINALTTDFVNRDDPVQRSAIEQDRKKALAELDRVRKEVEDRTKAIADLEEQARKAGVPAGWLR
jgi:hypothetical protein